MNEPESRRFAAAYGVSERTARRHLRNGTVPAAGRTRGKDGKSYPALRKPRSTKSPHHSDIVMARNAIRRLARAETIYAADLEEIEIIRREAIELWRRWRDAVDASDPSEGST